MNTAALQLGLSLRDARWRPVMDVNGAMAALDLDAREVAELAETPGMLIAWNIAVDDSLRSGTRHDPHPPKCLRILTRAIEHYRATLGSRRLEMEWPDVFRLLLPPGHSSEALLGTDIQRSLNCSDELVLDLIRAGKLDLVPNTIWKRGPAGSPQVLRASFERFLKARLL
jgi:hypothetical protein